METQGLGNRGYPPGPNSMVKTPEFPLYPVRRYHHERTRAQTDEARGQRESKRVRDALKVAVAAGEVSSFTVSAVTGITFRFVLSRSPMTKPDIRGLAVPQFAECCGQRR